MKLFINTFGGFEITAGEQSLLKESSRTYKLYKLFQYFVTFRNKKLLPETILDNLWADSESSDPKNVLRTQLFRLRRVIKLLLPQDCDENDYISINFINGYYCLGIGKNTIIDIDEFESLISQGDNDLTKNVENSMALYGKAIKLYKGLYLSENAYEVWLVPTRNYYQRLYLKTLYKLIELLKEKEDFEKIISLCECALLIEPYEEDIHINLMETMLKLGQFKSAMNHYSYTEFLLEKEMGTKPSARFTEMFKKIQSNSSSKNETDNFFIKQKLDDHSEDGPMHCDFEHFKFLFNMQKRKLLRNNENDYLGVITLSHGQNRYYEANELGYWSKTMMEILGSSLRKGDIYTFWNDSQILIMLHDVKGDGIIKVEDRIRNNMKNYENFNKYKIPIIFQSLISDDTQI